MRSTPTRNWSTSSTRALISRSARRHRRSPTGSPSRFRPALPRPAGGEGGGLGYVNILNSVAVKFDIYDSGAGPTVSTTGVYVNGAAPADGNQPIDATTPAAPGNSIDLTMTAQGNATGINFHTNPSHDYRVHLVDDGTTLTETVTDTNTNASVTQAYTIDIPGTIAMPCCVVGFTGADAGDTLRAGHHEVDLHQRQRPTLHLPADFNGDGQQNFADLLILAPELRKNQPATFAEGDANGDGTVNFPDVLILAQNYGRTMPPPPGRRPRPPRPRRCSIN